MLARAVTPLVDFVYPPRCPLCGEGIAAGPGLCADCWTELELPGEPACSQCQIPLPQGDGETACQACIGAPPAHAGVAAATLYNDAARKLVLKFKHGGRIGLATLMGRLIAGRLAATPRDAVLVPVPLHSVRLWMRGYNQAALLAYRIGDVTGHEVNVDALRRIRPTPKLGGLGRAARARALAGAIVMKPSRTASIQGRHVILVDDVLTSGATSAVCTRVLLDAGARSVRIACFARVSGKVGPENETPGTDTIPGAA